MDRSNQPKKVFSKLGFCYLAGTIAVFVLQQAVIFFLSKAKPEWTESIGVMLIVSCITVYGIGMPLIVLLAKRIPAEKPERHSMKWWQFLLALMMCYALMVISNLIGTAITLLIGALKGSAVQNNLLDVVTGGNVFVNFIAMVILAPIVEEYVFRKVLVDRVIRYGQGVAVVVSGLMFGLFHGNLNQFAYAIMLGGFFAFLYIKTGNLKITIGMHAIINFMGSMVAPQILKLIQFGEADLTDMNALLNNVQENPVGWIVYVLYILFIWGVVLGGLVMFIVSLCCKKFTLASGEESLPKGQRFKTVMVNAGMLTFTAVWIVLIVIQLFE